MPDLFNIIVWSHLSVTRFPKNALKVQKDWRMTLKNKFFFCSHQNGEREGEFASVQLQRTIHVKVTTYYCALDEDFDNLLLWNKLACSGLPSLPMWNLTNSTRTLRLTRTTSRPLCCGLRQGQRVCCLISQFLGLCLCLFLCLVLSLCLSFFCLYPHSVYCCNLSFVSRSLSF